MTTQPPPLFAPPPAGVEPPRKRLSGPMIVVIILGACALGVVVLGIAAAIIIPGLLRARMSGNEASAMGSLLAIVSAQMVYASDCGAGAFAPSLEILGRPNATRPGSPAYLSLDLARPEPVEKVGYAVRLVHTPDGSAAASCNGVPAGQSARTWAALATPTNPGVTGRRYFAVDATGVVYESLSPI